MLARPVAETFHLARPPVIIAASVKESAAQMHRLRDQMQELRAELRVSLGQLNQTIDSLQREMEQPNSKNHVRAAQRGRIVAVLEQHHVNRSFAHSGDSGL